MSNPENHELEEESAQVTETAEENGSEKVDAKSNGKETQENVTDNARKVPGHDSVKIKRS